MAQRVHYITWSLDEEGRKTRVRALYDQPLEVVVEQARHDVEVNNRVGVRVETPAGKIVWEPE